MRFLTPQRIESEEVLDAGDVSHEERTASLGDLRWINARLGGIHAFRTLLVRLGCDPAHASVLDVGTGSSDLLQSLPPSAALRVGLDFRIEHLLFGRRFDGPKRIVRVVGDVHCLPFRDGSIDVVTSGHLFHHFSPDENREILDEALRVARRGVGVNDTIRHRAPLAFIRLLSFAGFFSRVTRSDAPASVMQGYTRSEARAIAKRTKASGSTDFDIVPYRFGLILWK